MIWNSVNWAENVTVHEFDSHRMKGRQIPEYIGLLYRITAQQRTSL